MIKKTNFLLRKIIFPQLTWKVDTDQKELYLTFDDGPIPKVTEWVLAILEEYEAKATFFCVGENIQKYPEIFQKIVEKGHAVGNHSFNHLKGWYTPNDLYFENIEKCQAEILKHLSSQKKALYRPPHGQISYKQISTLQKTYQIVMWHVLTKDYDKNFDKEDCLAAAIKNTEKGSIIVFHDSIKAEKNLYYVLPRFLEFFKNKGYKFKKMSTNSM